MNNKAVTMEDLATITFGVELEYECISRQQAANAVARATGGTVDYMTQGRPHSPITVVMPDGREWKCETDGSLANGCETVSPKLTVADMDTLQSVVRELRAAGAKTKTPWGRTTTGLHVHVGAGDCTPTQIKNLVRIFHKQEDLILKAAGTCRSRLTRYTRPTDEGFVQRIEKLADPTWDDLNKAWFGTPQVQYAHHYNESRYRTMNLCNLWKTRQQRDNGGEPTKTVEFRFFEATTHAGEIRTNVLLAITLVHYAKHVRAAQAKKREYCRASSKYDLRVFLLRLGWIGEDYANPRKHALERLGGNAAWKSASAKRIGERRQAARRRAAREEAA